MQEIYHAYFASFSIIMGTTLPFLMEAINNFFNLSSRTVKSIVSWTVPIVLLLAAWVMANFLDAGFLYHMPWYMALFYGAWAALMSNVCWNNVPWLKNIVVELFHRLEKYLSNKNNNESFPQ